MSEFNEEAYSKLNKCLDQHIGLLSSKLYDVKDWAHMTIKLLERFEEWHELSALPTKDEIIHNQENEIQSLKSQNKKLRECLKLYSDEKRWRKQTKTTWTICPRDDVEYKNSHHYGVGGKRARECLKGLE